MAHGAIDFPPAPPDARAQVIVPQRPAQMPPAPPTRTERQVGDANIWGHTTLGGVSDAASAAQWPGGRARVDFAGEVTRLAIWADEPLYVAFSSTCGTDVGGYDLFHPGEGTASWPIPPNRSITIATTTGAAPTTRVEVYGYGGAYALR